MRISYLLLLTLAPLVQPAISQPAFPEPARAYGKYLVEICAVDAVQSSVSCYNPDHAAVTPGVNPVIRAAAAQENRTPQTITLKLVCAPGTPPPSPGAKCTAPYPASKDTDFYVEGTSDSGLPVTQAVASGAVTSSGVTGVVHYHVLSEGTVVIRATQSGNAQYQPAAPVAFALAIAQKTDSACGLFPAQNQSPQKLAAIDLASIVTLLGTPTPYTLTAQGNNTILIYSSRIPLWPKPAPPARGRQVNEARSYDEEDAVLESIHRGMAALLGRTAASLALSPATPFSVELTIPHAPALGDLATRLNSLNYSQFTIQDVGKDRIRVTAPMQPDCDLWTSFLTDVRHNAWQISPEPLNTRLYYLANSNGATYTAAPDVVTAFTALSGAPAAAAATPAASAAPAAAGAPATNNAAISITQPPGSFVAVQSDTVTCALPGAAGCTPATATSPASGAAAPAGPTPPASTPPAQPSLLMSALGTDQLLFAGLNPGDEGLLTERKRVLALLDLPRPEMIINGWVIQNSTTSPEAMGAFNGVVKDAVNQFNGALENVILLGWHSIKTQMAAGNYFDEPFYHYIADRYVADNVPATAASAPESPAMRPDQAAQQFLNNGSTALATPSPGKLSDFGICDPGHYCLGYTSIFDPIKPRLTDLLLAIAAAKRPEDTAIAAATFVETANIAPPAPPMLGSCDKLPRNERDRCTTIFNSLDLRMFVPPAGLPLSSCDSRDVLEAFSAHILASAGAPRMFLACFKEAALKFLQSKDNTVPTLAGLLRSQIADFLFNYKMSQQYPHEFAYYNLSQSADTLNSALSLLMDAFNRDVTAFQRYMRAEVQYEVERLNREHDQRCCVKRLFGLDKPSFFNDGIVTVRTISGQWTGVLTTSQSFVDASSAPTIQGLLSAVPGGAGAATAPTTTTQAIANAASAYQTTYAQIGRSLALTAIPRSLASASSAEIIVSLNADDSADAPTFYGGPQNGTPANLSRVSQHDTSTRVRVESVKLFEISSFSAALQKSRSRFPLIPPFVQLPYIGTIAGIPLPAAKEYHASTAILSAIVVPTAADLAYGLEFLPDQVVVGQEGVQTCSYRPGAAGAGVKPCKLHDAVSLTDFGGKPISGYNRAIVRCLATDRQAPYASINGPTEASRGACAALSFVQLPQ